MKKIIFVTGDKGGVGKTFTSRLLETYLSKSDIIYKTFETDKTNSSFKRFSIANTDFVDLDKQGDADIIFESLVENENLQINLVDCAARTMDKIIDWLNEVDISSLSNEFNISVEFYYVLGSDKDSLQILNDLIKKIDESDLPINLRLVKNYGRSDSYTLFDSSKLSNICETKNIKTITLKPLLNRPNLTIDRHNLNFLQACEDDNLSILDRQRVFTYVNQSIKSFEDIGVLNG